MNRNRHLKRLNVLQERRIKNIKRKHDRIDQVVTIFGAALIIAIMAIGIITTTILAF